MFLIVHEAHQSLGTHVRIGPNHISISDPKAVEQIYGHGANFLKDAWYDGGAGEHRHMSDARVKEEHRNKRKLLAHVFAQKSLSELEPVISSTISTLIQQFSNHAESNRPMNIRNYLNYFTIDVFGRMLYSQSFGCLGRGDDMVTAETSSGETYQVPFIQSLHRATQINTILGMEAGLLPVTKFLFAKHPWKTAGADYDGIILHGANKRKNDQRALDDIYSKLLRKSDGTPTNLPWGEVLAECSVMMNAGTDTTTSALTSTIYLLCRHPDSMAKLQAELDAAVPLGTVPQYETVSKLPYLRACIEESLRIRPASSFGLPRVVPKGGRVIAGQFIAEDVTVSVPTYTLLRDPGAFDKPEMFKPERWIDGDKQRMAEAHLPFSTGPRACIGRNISYYEQILVVSTIIRNFDIVIKDTQRELEIIERFNSNPGDLYIECSKRLT
ncbi:hypothetical protein G7054_g11493 [Neopestalotiopsis clavispora]|nr:hypothetical protein G7054_g11493 [Neopestalotiopsis clavispora]